MSVEGTCKDEQQPGQECMWEVAVLSYRSLLWNPYTKPPVSWKTNLLLGSPIFMAFHCDRIPKVTEDVYVHLCIHSSNSCKFTSQFRELFEAAAVEHDRRSSWCWCELLCPVRSVFQVRLYPTTSLHSSFMIQISYQLTDLLLNCCCIW
jgi:hypothetical protein